MHLSPSAKDKAIALLDAGNGTPTVHGGGEIAKQLET
jgi:hypothetical protein